MEVIDISSETEEEMSWVYWESLVDNERDCLAVTGFTPEDFLKLFAIVSNRVAPDKDHTKEDRLIMVLYYLKHSPSITKLKEVFSVTKKKVSAILDETIHGIYMILYQHYVENLPDNNERNEDFLNSNYLLNTVFQPILVTSKKKRYYSEEHQTCGFKSQCLHNRQGLIVDCIPGIKGKMTAKEIYEEYENISKDDDIILANDCYRGSGNVVVSYQNPGNKHQLMFNKKLGNELSLTDKFYQRMKSRHRILLVKFCKSQREYKKIFKLCVALTNFHVLENPL